MGTCIGRELEGLTDERSGRGLEMMFVVQTLYLSAETEDLNFASLIALSREITVCLVKFTRFSINEILLKLLGMQEKSAGLSLFVYDNGKCRSMPVSRREGVINGAGL